MTTIIESTPMDSKESGISTGKDTTENGKEKELYFLILYRRKEKENEKDFTFTKCDALPEKINEKEIKGTNENSYLYIKVFKINKKPKKKKGHKKGGEDEKGEDKKSEHKKHKKKKKKKEIVQKRKIN